MRVVEEPKGWGTDGVTKFLNLTRENEFATFANLRPLWNHLAAIEAVMQKGATHLDNSDRSLAGLFLLRAHSSYLGALRMVLSGQVMESYALLRACLEAALYGHHVSRHRDAFEVWLSRHNSPEATRAVRKRFQAAKLLEELEDVSPDTHRVADALYERTIDLGAHPNERAVTSTLDYKETDEAFQFHSNYVVGDSVVMRNSMKTTAQVGVNVMDILGLVFLKRFEILGILDELDRLREPL